MRALSGVTAAGFSSSPPLTDTSTTLSGSLRVRTPNGTHTVQKIGAQFVSRGYFEALGTPLVRGRYLSEEDERAGAIVVNAAFCRRMLGDSDPLASALVFAGDVFAIVGVVADSRQLSDVGAAGALDSAAAATVFMPISRYRRPPTWGFLVVRMGGPSSGKTPDLSGELLAIDPGLVVGEPTSFAQILSVKTVGQRRLLTVLSAMACVILLLTTASVSAALNQIVTFKSGEIAIRFCLGAGVRQMLASVLRSFGLILGGGLLAGAAAGVVLSRSLTTQLQGVSPADPLALAGAIGVLIAIGGIAAVQPLYRASRVDPGSTIRGS